MGEVEACLMNKTDELRQLFYSLLCKGAMLVVAWFSWRSDEPMGIG